MPKNQQTRNEIINGLQSKIGWQCNNARSSNEIAHTINVLLNTADSYIKEDCIDDFYKELEKKLLLVKKNK